MVTLVCFCCGHGNPMGARFCNACGAPLNLKPCKQCEAINGRAAAHCHRCGETFALQFASTGPEVGTPVEPANESGGSSPGVATGEMSARPWRRLAAARAAVVVLCMSATVMLSAYYVQRQGEPADEVTAVGGPAQTSQPASVAPAEASPGSTPGEESGIIPPRAIPVSTVGPKVTLGAPVLEVAPPRGEGAAPARAFDFDAQGLVAPRPSSVHEGTKRDAKPGATNRGLRTGQGESLAAGRKRDHADRKSSDTGRQQRAAATRVRPASAEPTRARARPATPVPAWGTPPCAEGIAPDSSCDVRMMAKGN